VLKLAQLNLFGEIDPLISFEFEPLYSTDEVEQATKRKTDADTDAVLVSIGAISPDEVRQRLGDDPDSGYDNLAEGEGDPDDAMNDRTNTLEVKDKINDQ
jgi:hypothetical protein